MSRGYPTPNEPTGDIEFSCIPVYVPSNPEFEGIFAAAIYGLYASMSKEYFWRELGTMSAQDAAFLAARGLAASQAYDGLCGEGGEMSCIDVADCIETDETVQNAIEQTITNEGFIPNPDTNLDPNPSPSLKPSAKSENLLPTALVSDCENNPQWAMGLARAIVKELHESAEDLFEAIEFATNIAEGVAQAAEQIPVLGKAVSGAIEFTDWVIETMKETYAAAYNQSTEDSLSCAIFCHIMAECSLSIDDLISIYEENGSIESPPLNDLEAVLTFAIEFSPDTDLITVAIFHYQILRLLSWSSVAGLSAAYLKSLLVTNVSAYDYSYQDLCEDCPQDETPDNFWRLYFDFRISDQGWVPISSSGYYGAVWDNGWLTPIPTNVTGQTGGDILYPDLGDAYQLAGAAYETQRRGSTGSGTLDTIESFIYSAPNAGGTLTGYQSYNTINIDGNNIIVGDDNLGGYSAYTQSIVQRNRVGGGESSGSRFAKTLRVVYYGLPLELGTKKPPRSTWVSSVPTTPEEMLNG